jgi:hypothetical protein
MRLPGSLFRRRLARSRACSGPFRGALRGRPGERRALLSRALRRSRFFRRRANGFHTSLYSATAAADPLITPTTTSKTVRKNATFVPSHTTKTAIFARHGGALNAFA